MEEQRNISGVSGGTAQYSEDGTNYSTTAPTYKDFTNGAKTVYVKVVGDGNHTDSDVATSSITISKKSITVTGDNKSKTYGAANPTLTATVGSTGITGETGKTTGAPATTATASSAVGTYDITVGTLALTDNGTFKAANYSMSYTKGTLTVNKATSYQISFNNSTWETATSGSKYVNKTSSGTKTAYVKAITTNSNYNSPSTAGSKSVEVYSLTLSKGTGISAVSNGGTSTTSACYYVSGKQVSIDATVQSGYTWSTWTKSAGTNPASATTKNTTVTIGANTTLTATAIANTYTVKYNGNGATGGSTAQSTHTYDTFKALTANGFSRTGYTFTGWSTNAGDEVKCYDNAEYSGSKPAGSSGYTDFKSYTIEPSFSSGQIYQLDVDVKGSGTLNNYFYGPDGYLRVASWYSTKSDGTHASGTSTDGANTIPLTSSYTHYTVRFTLGSTGDGSLPKYLLFRAMPGCSATIKNVRLNKVTASTTAYSDQQSVLNLTTSGTVNLYALWVKNTYKNTSTNIYYGTLNSAFYAANAGQTIEMQTNDTSTGAKTFRNVTLNTNGKTLTLSGTIRVASSTTLTLSGSGTISPDGSLIDLFTIYGSMTMDNTTINNTSIRDTAINVESSGTFTMNSGTIQNTKVYNNGTFIMNNGNITITTYWKDNENSTSSSVRKGVHNYGTFTMYNGNITHNSSSAICTENNSTTNIRGGNITTTDTSNSYIGSLVSIKGTLNMSGGTIDGNNSIAMSLSGSANITGGTITTNNTYYAIDTNNSTGGLTLGTNDSTVNINNPTITGPSAYYVIRNNGSTVNFYDGIIQGRSGGSTLYDNPTSVPSGGYGVCTTTNNGVRTSVIRKGDVNSDKIVNQTDLNLLQQYINGASVTIDTTAADVDSSGSINMKDVTRLQSYLNGDLTIN